MKTAFLSLALLASLAASAETKQDTLVVTTNPQMHCAGCENRIKKNIRFVKGTKKITTSLPKQRVTIVYDKSKASFTDYEKAFKQINFEVKPVKE